MTNIYFSDEKINTNDLYFLCYMIERVARKLKQRNSYVVNSIDKQEWIHLISVANVLHCENPLTIEEQWILNYSLQEGDFDISQVDKDLVSQIPTPTQMGKVYQRLIVDTLLPDENYVDGLIRVYNNNLCEVIDNYNCSAYYEPSYVIAKAYNEGGF